MSRDPNSTRLITKYKNRHLYDTELRRFIQLVDLYEMAKEGQVFEVKEIGTGKDVTRPVLIETIQKHLIPQFDFPAHYLREVLRNYPENGSPIATLFGIDLSGFVRKDDPDQSVTGSNQAITDKREIEKPSKNIINHSVRDSDELPAGSNNVSLASTTTF